MNPTDIHKYIVDLIHEGAGSIAGFLIGVIVGAYVLFLVRRRAARQVVADLRTENESLRADRDRWAARCNRVQVQHSSVKRQYDDARATVRDWWSRCRKQVRKMNVQAERSHEEVTQKLTAATSVANRATAAANDRRNPWLRPVPPEAPRVVPLADRPTPIIALLNFKGGVGKTTLTANLAATLAARGERVLMIDLDYQGSLTELVLPLADLRVAAAERRLVQDYFAGRAEADRFRPVIHHLARSGERIAIVPATDPLADVETWRQIRWLIRRRGRDIRLALRSALHDPAVFAAFDRVVIDCPPRLTTACVNALACCDYVLMPVLLDRTSTLAAPRLLRLLKELRPVLMSDAVGVGLVANRVTRAPLTGDERQLWDDVAVECSDQWGRPVDRMTNVVPNRVAFRDAANAHRFAIDDDPMIRAIFADLASDLADKVPRDRCRTAPIPQ